MFRRNSLRPRRRRTVNSRALIAIALVIGLVIAIPAFLRGGGSIAIAGLDNDEVLGANAAGALSIRVEPHGVSGGSLHAKIDGQQITLTPEGSAYLAKPTGLSDGKHEFVVSGSHGLFGRANVKRDFTVDSTPPALTLSVPNKDVSIGDPVDVTGHVTDGSKVTAAGGEVTVHGTSFSIRYAHPPIGAAVIATDAAGNRTVKRVTVPTAYPEAIRGVHMTGYAWASTTLRKPILRLARQHRINTIELDIKEEDGIVDFDPHVALATKAHAVLVKYDPAAVVRQLHSMGVRVIGRIVAFNDPKLGAWAWKHGHHDWVIQTPHHTPYVYGYAHSNFTNFANPVVRQYNIDLGKAAVRAGFDDIVYDYIRRPDGSLNTMRFPGIKSAQAESAIVGFSRDAAQQLHAMGAYVGATIFAQAALPNRAVETAQNVPMMAHYLDAVMPMDYPSHWAMHELGVANPHVNVYGIVNKSLRYWQRAVKGTHCKVVAWLQDEDYLGNYTAAVVTREIQGARNDGLPGWVMWSATARYTGAAYTPDAVKVLN